MNKRNLIIILIVVIVVVAAWLFLPSENASQKAGEEIKEIDTLIEFYGKVTDQNSDPINSATIKFSFANTTTENGSLQETQSDSAGLFSLKGNRVGTSIEVSKDGYAMTEQSKGVFRYVRNGLVKKDNPAIFILRIEE